MDEFRGRPVQEMWWEGEDLHIVFADGSQEYYVLSGVYVTGMNHEWKQDEGVLVEEYIIPEKKP